MEPYNYKRVEAGRHFFISNYKQITQGVERSSFLYIKYVVIMQGVERWVVRVEGECIMYV